MGIFNFLRTKKKAAAARTPPAVATRLRVEELESRLVPYALSGGAWPNPQLITISFEPDGTILGTNSNGGFITSNLFATMNARFGSPAVWENLILKGAQAWAQQTNINFAVVADDGASIGSGNYEQGDPNMGDIRIGGYNFGNASLAQTFMPPPADNYSIAGDMQFNTGKTFNNGTTYDLTTVAEHEIGHALGLYHSTNTSAVMYANYHGVTTTLTADDIAGIRSIYSAGLPRSPDVYLGLNNNFLTATPLTTLLDPMAMSAAVNNLSLSTAGTAEYFVVAAPLQTSGTFTVTAQSAGLSLLAPNLTVYAADQVTALGSASGAGQYGTTLQVALTNVSPGEVFYIKVAGADSSAFGTGAYGLTLNFGTGANPALTMPNTQVLNGDPLTAGGGQALQMSPQVQVNTYTGGITVADGSQAVGMDAAGDYVVVWASQGEGGSGWGVYGQRYSADGTPLNGEFQVNDTTVGDQDAPAVAVNPDGSFEVVWQSDGVNGSGPGIYAKQYDVSGNPLSSEFLVNTTTSGDATAPAVASDANGNFVVTWQSNSSGNWAIYGQRYDAAGNPQSGEFLVSNSTGDQEAPHVAMDPAGDFVVIWQSHGQSGYWTIDGQRYNAAGDPQGTVFQVSALATSDQINPTVAMDLLGDFVVAWQSGGQDGSGYGIDARVYDNNGVAAPAFVASNTTTGDQEFPTVAMNASGDFLVGWSSYGQDGRGWSSYGRQFTGGGVAEGDEFILNSSTAGNQVRPFWAYASNGDAVAVWSGTGAGGGSDVFAARFLITVAAGTAALDGDYAAAGQNTTGLPCCCPACMAARAAAARIASEAPNAGVKAGGMKVHQAPGHLSHGTFTIPHGAASAGAMPPGTPGNAGAGEDLLVWLALPEDASTGVAPVEVATGPDTAAGAVGGTTPPLSAVPGQPMASSWTQLTSDSFTDVTWLEGVGLDQGTTRTSTP